MADSSTAPFVMHGARDATVNGFGHIEEQVKGIERAVAENPGLAFDLAKTVIESACRAVLSERSISLSEADDLPKLFNRFQAGERTQSEICRCGVVARSCRPPQQYSELLDMEKWPAPVIRLFLGELKPPAAPIQPFRMPWTPSVDREKDCASSQAILKPTRGGQSCLSSHEPQFNDEMTEWL
jgi:hypothetical protein